MTQRKEERHTEISKRLDSLSFRLEAIVSAINDNLNALHERLNRIEAQLERIERQLFPEPGTTAAARRMNQFLRDQDSLEGRLAAELKAKQAAYERDLEQHPGRLSEAIPSEPPAAG